METRQKPRLAPEANRTINTTNLIITMSTGLADTEFLSLLEFIIGASEWFEPEPRPCPAGWRSTTQELHNVEIGYVAQQMIGWKIMDMIEDQHREAAELIKETRKYLPRLRNRDYPRPKDSDIKVWTDEKGNLRHNIAIVNKKDELIRKVDPIRRRVGFPETLKFHENDKTRKSLEYMASHLDTMNSIIGMHADSFGTKPAEPKDAVPRIRDRTMANIVQRELGGR